MKLRTQLFIRSLAPCAALALSACAEQALVPQESAIDHQVVYVADGERMPAEAVESRWTPTIFDVDVRGTTDTSSATVTVKQETSWWDNETFPDVRTDQRDVEVPYVCTDLACPTAGGRAPMWEGFAAAKKDDKDDWLERAIHGLGHSMAQRLVLNGYFANGKPASWDAFAAEINRAAKASVIPKSVATQVIFTYRLENASALGYFANACTERVRPCSAWVSQLVSVPFTNNRRVERKRITDKRSFATTIQVTNARLLPSERDRVQLQIDEKGGVRPDAAGIYNRYSVTSSSPGANQLLINVVGVQRYLRPLPESIVRQVAFQIVNKLPTFVVDIDPTLLPDSRDPRSQLVLDYQLKACDVSWVTGGCKAFQSTKTIKSGVVPVKETREILAFDGGTPDTKLWVEFTIARRGSLFFDDHPIALRVSDPLKQ